MHWCGIVYCFSCLFVYTSSLHLTKCHIPPSVKYLLCCVNLYTCAHYCVYITVQIFVSVWSSHALHQRALSKMTLGLVRSVKVPALCFVQWVVCIVFPVNGVKYHLNKVFFAVCFEQSVTLPSVRFLVCSVLRQVLVVCFVQCALSKVFWTKCALSKVCFEQSVLSKVCFE